MRPQIGKPLLWKYELPKGKKADDISNYILSMVS